MLVMLSQANQNNLTVIDNGHTIQVDFKDGSLVFWDTNGDSEAFYLSQYHIHAPSEHTFDG